MFPDVCYFVQQVVLIDFKWFIHLINLGLVKCGAQDFSLLKGWSPTLASQLDLIRDRKFSQIELCFFFS